MLFIGIDLAWSPRRTSAVTVIGNRRGATVIKAMRADLVGAAEVADFIDSATGKSPATVAIDAPLVVPNATGMRLCDRMASSLFRSYKAGVHPVNRSNLSRYDGFQGEAVAQALTERGYVHAIPPQPRKRARTFFETYPHAAAIVLFQLPERLEYKARGARRPWSVRRRAFRMYQNHLRGLRDSTPPLILDDELLRERLDDSPESKRKRYEDMLDSLLCAYVSYYYWYWGISRCSVLGTLKDGYMILPMNSRLRARMSALSGASADQVSQTSVDISP